MMKRALAKQLIEVGLRRTCYLIIIFLCVSSYSVFGDEKSLDGVQKEFYENGTLKREVPYVQGKRQGIAREYYPTGVLRATFEYKDDVWNGIVAKYYATGKLEHESIYENGRPNSKGVRIFRYYDDGRTKYEYFYDKDEGGYRKEYYPNGQPSLEMTIEGWNAYSCKNYGEDGHLTSTECPKDTPIDEALQDALQDSGDRLR